MPGPALIIFIKNPVPGKCKTRLAKTIGDEAAATVYRKLLAYTRMICLKFEGDKYLYYDGFINENDDWHPDTFTKRIQLQANLGLRMEHALSEVLMNHDSAVIIGSDCPELKIRHIQSPFEALNDEDVVIGPSFDGGYYLIGMKRVHKILFNDIVWSSSAVFDVSQERLNENKISLSILEKLHDLDNADDLALFPECHP